MMPERFQALATGVMVVMLVFTVAVAVVVFGVFY
jgi:hypothetical protein